MIGTDHKSAGRAEYQRRIDIVSIARQAGPDACAVRVTGQSEE